MKRKQLLTLKAAFLGVIGAVSAQDAQIQVIHNSPDPGAAAVDIFVNGTEVLSDVNYREASSFLAVDASGPINVGIAAAAPDNDASDILFPFVFNLTPGEDYYVVADGLIGTTFDLYAAGARTSATSGAGNTDFMIYHGSIDAPAVDIYAEEAGANLANDLTWSNFNTGFSEVGNADYNVQVRNDASTATVATYSAPLQTLGLEDSSLLVMASGYLSPAPGQPAFGLFAVTTDGAVTPLPTSAARAQVIHNVSLAAAATVDVWVNGAKALEGVGYQDASAFIDFPAGIDNVVELKANPSVAGDAALYTQNITTEARESYYVIANGDGTSQPIALAANTGAREAATSGSGNVDFQVFHGSATAPAVDVYVNEVGGNIAEDLAFGAFSAYAEVAAGDYNVEVRNDASTYTVQSYGAPLSTLSLDDQAFIVVASGYLGTADADSAFTLLAVLADGSVVPLPTTAARAQIVHNSAVAGPVDIWVNGVKTALVGVDYRQASAFIDFPAGIGQTVAVTATGATDTVGAPINVTLNTDFDDTYYVVASGGDGGKPLELHLTGGAREAALEGTNTDVMVYHGSTNAPTVDVWEVGVVGGEIVNDLEYAEFDGYLELGTDDYILEVRDDAGSEPALFSYGAPLETLSLDGASVLVIASGTVGGSDPSDFGLLAVLADGSVVPLPEETVGFEETAVEGLQSWPNPVNDRLSVTFDGFEALDYQVFSADGRVVLSGLINNNQQIDLSELAGGTYVVTLSNNSVSSAINVVKK